MTAQAPTDAPKTLASPTERRRREALLGEPHVAALTKFAKKIRRERGVGRDVPFFDPLDGGVNAPLPFVPEAPAPKAVESGFVSRNNPDESAKNFFLACQAAELRREEMVVWNIVPWYIGESRSAAATASPTPARSARRTACRRGSGRMAWHS
jgi:hypothetical protein